MLRRKLLACLVALLALCAAYVRPAYTVSVGGIELPGKWSRGDIDAAVRSAQAAAEEISRGDAALPELETRLTVNLSSSSGNSSELTLALLAGASGVEQAWDVLVDGVAVGRTDDRTALDEILMAAIAEVAPADSTRTGFDSEITLKEVYVPTGRHTDLMELSSRIRSLVRVSYVTSDGQTHYA